MNRFTRIIAAAVVGLLMQACAGSAIYASCGDYLAGHVQDGASPFRVGHDVFPESTAHPSPCQGPLCQRSPHELPSVPPAPNVLPEFDDQAGLISDAVGGHGHVGRRHLAEQLALPSGHPVAIERPPRS